MRRGGGEGGEGGCWRCWTVFTVCVLSDVMICCCVFGGWAACAVLTMTVRDTNCSSCAAGSGAPGCIPGGRRATLGSGGVTGAVGATSPAVVNSPRMGPAARRSVTGLTSTGICSVNRSPSSSTWRSLASNSVAWPGGYCQLPGCRNSLERVRAAGNWDCGRLPHRQVRPLQSLREE